ncbi:MAG: hypothetical protein PHU25_01335 [Deltaproteobacteria bacterium]|nr:hypothetical protein [Deltaproteobacteria bacterium]
MTNRMVSRRKITTAERWARRIRFWQERLAPELPDIPPEDLALILSSILQPRSVPRRWLLRKVTDDGYAL